ncbi:MAG: hypothetical protein RhofKO_08340 [Rhodothermales bacterium]
MGAVESEQFGINHRNYGMRGLRLPGRCKKQGTEAHQEQATHKE